MDAFAHFSPAIWSCFPSTFVRKKEHKKEYRTAGEKRTFLHRSQACKKSFFWRSEKKIQFSPKWRRELPFFPVPAGERERELIPDTRMRLDSFLKPPARSTMTIIEKGSCFPRTTPNHSRSGFSSSVRKWGPSRRHSSNNSLLLFQGGAWQLLSSSSRSHVCKK